MMSASELKKLFEKGVRLQSSLLEVKLSGKGLGDEQMTDLAQYLGQILPEPDPNATEEAVWATVELAENNIGNAGLITVLDALERYKVACKSLKLYRNKIGDEGGIRLGEMVRRQENAVDEIHLSHNMFSARSLVALCMALVKHEGYPAVGRNRLYIPCWVRMEYNNIARPQEVLEMLRRDGPVSICTADNRDDCGPWRCACSNKDKGNVPKVHLFTITNQSRRITAHEDTELREEIRKMGGTLQVIAPTGPAVRKTTPGPAIPLGPRGVAPPKPGMACRTPTANVANAPPRAPAWDTNGSGLRRAQTAPPAVGDVNSEDESGRSAKNGDSQYAEDADNSAWTPPPPAHEPVRAAELANSGEFSLSDKDDSPKREASGPDGFDPPARKTPNSGSQSPQESAASALLKRLQSGDGKAAAPKSPGSGAGPGENASSRKSVVLDGGGRRRILPKQLLEADNSGPFICPLCAFVIARPVITSCSHLFCEACFRSWVSDQVSKAKKSQAPEAPVPLVPCPQSVQSSCTGKLRKQDIMLLDKADGTKVGAVALLQRLRNNLRVRCVHHVDHFKYSFGQDAEKLSREAGLTCKWVGDLMAYDDHVAKSCPIESRLAERFPANGVRTGSPVAPPPPAVSAASPNSSAVTQKASTQTDAKGPPKAPSTQKPSTEPTRMNGNSNGGVPAESAGGGIPRPDGSSGDAGEVRVAQYDYVPRESDKAQIPLRRHDFVRVFEITDSGWAAGVRLSRDTMQEVGDAGWFPEGYLFPLTGAGQKKEQGPAF